MKKVFLFALIVISCITLVDLFHSGLPLTHDGRDHVARIANFYINLQQGNLIPRWAGNLNWGYGHPILEFLYPLPSYLASLFHSIGFSFIDSAKIVFGIGIMLSGIAMYLWLAEFLPVYAAFIGGLLYVFTPYRFVDLYIRGDIGENLAYAFMPLTLLFIYKLYKHGKGSLFLRNIYISLGAISFACLMLSHNAIVLMYFPFIIFYCVYLVYRSRNKKFLLSNSGLLILLGFAISAFFWIPALLEGKYTLRNIVTVGEYASRFVTFPQLLYGPWSYGGTGQFTVQLGIISWVMIAASLVAGYLLWKKKDSLYLMILGSLVYISVAIFLMLPQSNTIWQKSMLLQNFQFPWRFLAIPVFAASVLGAIIVASLLRTKIAWLRNVSIVVLVLLILFLNKDYWHANGYINKPDNFFSGIYDGTTDTGESSPIWSVRFMEKRSTLSMEVIGGKAIVTPRARSFTKHTYSVVVSTPASLRENTVYFPGWRVLVDGVETDIQYQDTHNRGVITFSVPKGKHTILIEYKETKLRLLADVVSLISIVIIIVMITTTYITKKSQLPYNT